MEKNKSKSGRISQNFDWAFFGLILLLCALGLMTLYSSAYLSNIQIFYKQIIYISVGSILAFVLAFVDYRIFERLAWPVYIIVMILIVVVAFIGKETAGSQRWLNLGPVHLQPSELAKFAVVLVLARFYSREKIAPLGGYGFKDLIPVYFIMGIPMVLVFLQPDLGTALMIGFVSASVIFVCKIRYRTLFIIVAAGLIVAPIAYNFVLKEYQRDRVRTFLNPQRDPLGEGYHSIQSMIAVGSGQVFGKGYLHGTQSKLEFLPEHHTDFIFSSFAEEWGFMGAIVVLVLFTLMTLMGADIARKSKDKFGAILAVGATSLLVWHVIVNIGMEIDLLPVVGVTLPFFSYGGSSILTNMLAVGILLSVSFRRHIF